MVAQAGEHRRVALRRRGRRPPASSQPGSTPQSDSRPAHPADEVGDDVGHEGRGDARLDLPSCAVLERGPRRGHRGGGVRDVVGDDLVGVDAAAAAHCGAGLVHQVLGQIDRVRGAGEVRCGGRRHGERP